MNENNYSLKQKKKVIRLVLIEKSSLLSAARAIGSDQKTVRRWLGLYKQYGEAGLKPRRGNYPGKFRVKVIRHMLKYNLSLSHTTIHFGIPGEGTVSRWLKTYGEKGESGLMVDLVRRKKFMMPKSKIKKGSESLEERLVSVESENEYLRTEIAFLKKLEALIQEENAVKIKNEQPKSFKN